MTTPLFIQVGDAVVNLSLCERVVLEDDTLSFSSGDETHQVVYASDAAATEALGKLRELLESRNLLIGSVP